MTRCLLVLRKILFLIVLASVLASTTFAIGFDLTFGSGGKFMTSFADSGQPSCGGTSVFIQPSGRIIVIGSHSQQGTTNRTSGIAIAGLTSGGLLDNTFGTGGKVLSWSATFHRFPTKALVLGDGSLLVLHQMWESASANRPVIAKFTASGQPDTFDADLDLVANQTSPVTIAQASSGKIYAVVRNGDQHYLVRLNANGSRDTTFGTNGVRSLNLNRFSTQPRVFALQELAGGKLLIAGTYQPMTSEGATFVARLDNDTNLDRSFGSQGAARISIPYGSVQGITLQVQPDGKVLIGGCWTFLGSTTLLFRLTTRGRLDANFGTGGVAQTNFNNTNVIRGIALAPDGTIFVAGSSGAKALPPNQRLFVIRYSSAGISQGSIVTNFIGTREAGASDILLQGDGRLLVAGFTQNAADDFLQLAVARFNQ